MGVKVYSTRSMRLNGSVLNWTWVLVDWHRAQRGRIGAAASNTNADWYCRLAQENPGIDVPVYGVPINTREALGVLHFKGFIIDDSVLYSGASLNDVYLHQHDKYRYDRYQLIRNRQMADIMFDWVTQNLMNGRGVNRLDNTQRPKSRRLKTISAYTVRSCVMRHIIFRVTLMTSNSPLRRWSGLANPVC